MVGQGQLSPWRVADWPVCPMRDKIALHVAKLGTDHAEQGAGQPRRGRRRAAHPYALLVCAVMLVGQEREAAGVNGVGRSRREAKTELADHGAGGPASPWAPAGMRQKVRRQSDGNIAVDLPVTRRCMSTPTLRSEAAMYGERLLSISAGIMLASQLSSPAIAHSPDQLEERLDEREIYVEMTGRPAPTFALRDPDGRAVRLEDYRGKVVVLWFIYTFCPDVCPLQSDAIADIQEQINRTPMRDIVQFVSITTDPARDTPEVLGTYGSQHGLDPANWTILTSGPEAAEATRAIAEEYGLKFTKVDDEYQVHAVVTHLIDKSGTLRARYHGLDFKPTNLILHVNALTNDTGENLPEQGPLQKLLHNVKDLIGVE